MKGALSCYFSQNCRVKGISPCEALFKVVRLSIALLLLKGKEHFIQHHVSSGELKTIYNLWSILMHLI